MEDDGEVHGDGILLGEGENGGGRTERSGESNERFEAEEEVISPDTNNVGDMQRKPRQIGDGQA